MEVTMNLDLIKEAMSVVRTTSMVWDNEAHGASGFKEQLVAPQVHIRDDKVVIGNDDGGLFCDYYGEYNEARWIHPELIKAARELGGTWQWENPGCIMFVYD